MDRAHTVINVESTIERPAREVWHGLTSPEVMPKWMGVESIRYEDASGPSVGATLLFTTRGKQRPSRVSEVQPERVVAFESVQGGVTAVYTYALEQLGDNRTKVTLRATCETRGLGWRLLRPLIGYAIKSTDGGQLQKLKQVLEADDT